MKYPWAYPGARVICVDALFARSDFRPLVAGMQYVIDTVYGNPNSRAKRLELKSYGSRYWNSEGCVHLVGIGPFPIGFAIERFKPVLPDTTETVKTLDVWPPVRELILEDA